MKKKLYALILAGVLVLSCAAFSACSSGSSSSTGESEDAADTTDEDVVEMTEEEVEAWYEENIYGQTLSGTIDEDWPFEEYTEEDEVGEIVLIEKSFGVVLDEVIPRDDGDVESVNFTYMTDEELEEITDGAWSYSDDTTFTFSDGSEASETDLTAGVSVTLTLADDGSLTSVVIGE